MANTNICINISLNFFYLLNKNIFIYTSQGVFFEEVYVGISVLTCKLSNNKVNIGKEGENSSSLEQIEKPTKLITS